MIIGKIGEKQMYDHFELAERLNALIAAHNEGAVEAEPATTVDLAAVNEAAARWRLTDQWMVAR